MGKTVIHFGAGALGRGLVIPMLNESGCKVIAVDTNDVLLDQLKKDNGYILNVSDDVQKPEHFIPLLDSIHSIKEKEKLLNALKEVDTVTTSVRRQNLKYVAPVLYEAWKDQDCCSKQIICCENVEDVGSIFRDLLNKQIQDPAEKERFDQIRIPDTIVDRICAMSKDCRVTSELFHEISVDQNIDSDTGIQYITSVENIKGHFYRKRYLLNSYADSISFVGFTEDLTYLYEAAKSEKINEIVYPMIQLYFELLEKKYNIPKEEAKEWFALYQKRLANPNIPRELPTVARNLWDKLSLEERFVCPLIECKELGIDVKEGLKVIRLMIHIDNKVNQVNDNEEQLLKHLYDCWAKNPAGVELYNEYLKLGE